MYIHQSDNCFTLSALSHCFILHPVYLSLSYFISLDYILVIIICSRFPFDNVLDPLLNGSSCSTNHLILDFNDPFNHSIQQLSNTWCTPSKNRSLVVLVQCIVCRGEELRTSQCLKRVLLPRKLLSSNSNREIPLQKVGTQLAKPFTQMQIKHEVTTSADMSSLRGCEMQCINWDEGSERWSRSLVCSSVIGI